MLKAAGQVKRVREERSPNLLKKIKINMCSLATVRSVPPYDVTRGHEDLLVGDFCHIWLCARHEYLEQENTAISQQEKRKKEKIRPVEQGLHYTLTEEFLTLKRQNLSENQPTTLKCTHALAAADSSSFIFCKPPVSGQ